MYLKELFNNFVYKRIGDKMFEKIEMAPADPILGLTDAFKKDINPAKINLGVGVYKNDDGVTPILATVKEAEKRILESETTKSYLSIQGSPEYGKCVRELIFGKDSEVLASNRAVTIQGAGGTGSLRVAADFLHKFFPNSKIWLSKPTWANHHQVFTAAKVEINEYPYYDKAIKGLNWDKMIESLSQVPKDDIVLFHACCHNPTGADISCEQWDILADMAKKQGFIPLFDFAYQGFGKGLNEDAYAIRTFAKKIKSFFVANSFSKNFGLYNERIGALTLVADNKEEAAAAFSQIKICVRANISNPPAHGAAIVTTILTDPELYSQWVKEVAEMRRRIRNFRELFVAKLKEYGVKQNFEFIKEQKGMFSYTGLELEQVLKLRNDYAIYFVNSGRISLAGINSKNIDRLCKSFAEVLAE